MLIAAEKISKQFGEKPLLNSCSLYINEGDKVGVIGRNGAGKSTLLKIIARRLQPDTGGVTLHGSFRMGVLPQMPEMTQGNTVLKQVMQDAKAAGVEAEEYEAKHILNKLKITDMGALVDTLSGGQKKRVALASVLVTHCELLLLDEPTNHLDDEMIEWLENYLMQYKGALLMVTHDRYFLDRVVSRIVDVQPRGVYLYDTNYSKYLELRAQREEMEAGAERKRQSLLRKELAWMQQGPKARGTKSRARIERYQQLEAEAGPEQVQKLELQSVSSRLGRKTIELQEVAKAYQGKMLIQGLDLLIPRDARIGVVGPNGCGKSTLLKLIAGEVQPDSGRIERGETVKVGYFAQDCGALDGNQRVIDYVKEFGETVETETGTISASQMLERFLFPPDLQWNTISRLSGGEQRRLYLLGILMTAPNILLLDEPTNDLDIDTLMVLEEYLEGFAGAVVLISHDRYFLDKTTDHILEFQGEGKIGRYLGGYSEYLNQRRETEPKELPKPEKKDSKKQAGSRTGKARFSYNEQREYEEIDAVIAGLEQTKAELEAAIAGAASNYEELQHLLEQQKQVEASLNEKTDRWLYLNTLADEIAKQAQEK